MTEQMTKRDALMHSIITVNGGPSRGGYTLGISQSIEYLLSLVLEDEPGLFIEGIASLTLHMIWVGTPPPMVDAIWVVADEILLENNIDKEQVDHLLRMGSRRVEEILDKEPKTDSGRGFLIKDGRFVTAEELLGLAGIQFIEDVAAMTLEDIEDVVQAHKERPH